MNVFDSSKMKELQDRLNNLTKKQNIDFSINLDNDDNDMNLIESKHSMSISNSTNFEYENRLKYFEFNKEDDEIFEIPKSILTKIETQKLNKVKDKINVNKNTNMNPILKKIVKVSINDIVYKLNKNSNSNRFSVFKE